MAIGQQTVTPTAAHGDTNRILTKAATSRSNKVFTKAVAVKKKLTIIVGNRLLTKEKIPNASLTITDNINGLTNSRGTVTLDFPADGNYVLTVTPPNANIGPVGPAIASAGKPPDRIFRPVNMALTIKNNRVTNATKAIEISPGSINFGPSQITVGLQPVWMYSPNNSVRPSGTSITLIVIHHTTGNSMPPPNFLEKGKQSAHYVIGTDGQILKMVMDSRISIHAGPSWWGGVSSVNNFSIGIEIVHQSGPYRELQYEALIELLKSLLTAYPTILPHRIVGHSDVGTGEGSKSGIVGRKGNDPGQDFEWERLEQIGLGLRPIAVSLPETYYGGFFTKYPKGRLTLDDDDIKKIYGGKAKPDIPIKGANPPIRELHEDLSKIGYSVGVKGSGIYDKQIEQAVLVFQQHFFSGTRKRKTNGLLDNETAIMIKKVLRSLPP
jgi:N-acetyl-anhydromuramyl-L-alanine amidase AmpD